MITAVEGEREGERVMKRTDEPGVLCYFKRTTIVMFCPLLRIGISLTFPCFNTLLVSIIKSISRISLFCAVHI
jgi:hypothetical protein